MSIALFKDSMKRKRFYFPITLVRMTARARKKRTLYLLKSVVFCLPFAQRIEFTAIFANLLDRLMLNPLLE
jgi:hypothetical protein